MIIRGKADIIARGYSLTFKEPKDNTAELVKFGEREYDHLIMYAPATKGKSSHRREGVSGQYQGVRDKV